MRVLFLCGANSCRSQMAEGWARHLIKGEHEFHSAGLRATGVNPLAVRAMMEAGVDISSHKSKTVENLQGDFHIVVTVCDAVKETCPYFPAAVKSIHKGFPDPPAMSEGLPDREKIMPYREVCAMIRRFVDTELRGMLETP
ncbi:MAG: arsenate reductase ArsC [Candidatus Fermentibacteraceae bacterium]